MSERSYHGATSRSLPVMDHWLEREIAQGVFIKDRSDDPYPQERTLLPRSYISLLTSHGTLAGTRNSSRGPP